jgi:PAS domain-containing protein
MVLVKRRVFLLTLLIVVLGIGVLGFAGYRVILAGADRTSDESAFFAERFLFIAGVVFIAAVAALLTMWSTGGRVLRLLDRIHELARLRGVPPENRLYRLGPLGGRIATLLSTVEEVSVKRASKISGLSSLAGFLTENVTVSLIVTDARGIIRYVSDRYAEKADRRKSELLDAPIDSVLPDIRSGEIVTEVARYRGYRQVESGNRSIDVYGIFDDARHLVYLVYSPDRDATHAAKAESEALLAAGTPKPGLFGRRLRELFDRKRSERIGPKGR